MTSARQAPYQRSCPHSPPRQDAPKGASVQQTEKKTAGTRSSLRFGGALTVLLLLLIAVVTLSLVLGFFAAMLKLNTLTVVWPSGTSAAVSEESVICASGLCAGDRLYAMNTAEIEEKILRENPYLAEVELERHLPDTVILRCTPQEAAYYLAVGGEWFAVSADLAVLEQSTNDAEFAGRGLVPLILPEVRSALVGRKLTFAETEDASYIAALLAEHRRSPLWAETDLLRIESRFDVRMIAYGSYALNLGTSRDIALKLELGEKILSDELFETNSGAFIDLTDPTEGSVILDKQTDYSVLWRG